MQPAEKFEPPIEINADNLPFLRFETPKEMLAWVQKESQFYETVIGKVSGQDPPLNQIWANVHPQFYNVIQNISNLNSTPNAKTGNYQNILNSLIENYKKGRLIESSSLLGESIKELQTTDPALAPRALAILSKSPI